MSIYTYKEDYHKIAGFDDVLYRSVVHEVKFEKVSFSNTNSWKAEYSWKVKVTIIIAACPNYLVNLDSMSIIINIEYLF